MRLVFDEQASIDLESIFTWLAQDSLTAADAVIERLIGSAELLTTFPLMGHAGRAAGTREWVVPRLPYVLVYQVDPIRDEIVVAAIFHEARDRDDHM
jgi:toxin ParE1/3/4